MKRIHVIEICFGLALLTAVAAGIRLLDDRQAALTAAAPSRSVVLIDAGHGGFDGGAVAADGVLEKDINLAVAADLSDLLCLMGYATTMTRTDDQALCEDTTLSIRERKRADMNARLALFDQATIAVSIHQNQFSSSDSWGAQVFYSPNHSSSRLLAEDIRQTLVNSLQPDNDRELKAGDRDILLLYKAKKPTVLVECGFLSNPQERQQLESTAYQQQLAVAIAGGIWAYQP